MTGHTALESHSRAGAMPPAPPVASARRAADDRDHHIGAVLDPQTVVVVVEPSGIPERLRADVEPGVAAFIQREELSVVAVPCQVHRRGVFKVDVGHDGWTSVERAYQPAS